jgi:hypothetical protein
MQRLKGRKLVLCALAVLACSVDPTGNEGTPTEITANPEVVFVTQGDSQAVIASVIDEQGQVLEADFIASNVGGGITVVEDPNFLGTETGVGIRRQARFFVKGVDLNATSFTLSALGLSKEISVTAVPPNLGSEISDTVPDPGEAVTITAPAGLVFDATSGVGVGIQSFVVTDRTETSITFIPPPNLDGPVTVTGVGTTFNPNLSFDLQTGVGIRTVALTAVAGIFSDDSPDLGQAITFTLPADVRVLPNAARLDSLRVATVDTRPLNVALSADSGTITFVPPPSSDSTLEIHGVVHRALPQYPLTLESTGNLTTPRIDSIAVTISDAAPELGESITLTAPAGMSFNTAADTSRSRVRFGAVNAVIQSITANTITIVPLPTGTNTTAINPVITSVIPDAAPQFRLPLPTTAPVTLPGLVPLQFTNNPRFAPSIAFPAAGATTTLFDAGAFGGPGDCCFDGPTRLYRLQVTATADLTFTVDWYEGQDLGVYITESDAVTVADDGNAIGDSFGSGPAGHPETVTATLDAGTYFVAIPNFSATNPNLFKITIDRAP